MDKNIRKNLSAKLLLDMRCIFLSNRFSEKPVKESKEDWKNHNWNQLDKKTSFIASTHIYYISITVKIYIDSIM